MLWTVPRSLERPLLYARVGSGFGIDLLQGLSRNGAYVTIAIFKQFKKGRNSGTELLPWSGRLPKAIAARTFSSEAEM